MLIVPRLYTNVTVELERETRGDQIVEMETDGSFWWTDDDGEDHEVLEVKSYERYELCN